MRKKYEVGDKVVAIKDQHGETPYQSNSCYAEIGQEYYIIGTNIDDRHMFASCVLSLSRGGKSISNGNIRIGNIKKVCEIIKYKENGILYRMA